MGQTSRACLLAASIAMLAACGQRSDLAGPCDGDTEASGGSYFCVGENLEQDQGEVSGGEREDASSLPDASPDLSPHIEDDGNSGTPEPPSSYPLDEKGFPVPLNVNSFRELETSRNGACILDEFSQLFCWELEFSEDGEIKSKLEGQARIERFYDRQTYDFALDSRMVCVENYNVALCKQFGDGEWVASLEIQRGRDPISPLSLHGNKLCGMLWQKPSCALIDLDGQREERFDAFAELLEWRDLSYDYQSFDLVNFSQGRNEVLCAVAQHEGDIVCRSAINFGWWKTDVIAAQTSNFTDVRTGYGHLAGLRVFGGVEIHAIDTWSAEGLTEAQTYRATVTPRVEKLYSNSCALTEDGQVIYWSHKQVHDMFEYAGSRTTVYHRVLDIETPKSFDVMPGHWNVGEAWCSLNERSQVTCGYFPKHEDW